MTYPKRRGARSDTNATSIRRHSPCAQTGARRDPPYTFVTEGVEVAVDQARGAAGGKDVHLMGASIVQQAIRAGLLDELIISLVPIVLGRGIRLLDNLDPGALKLNLERVVDAPGVTHLTYRVIK
jgi:dihydrofolate reductase